MIFSSVRQAGINLVSKRFIRRKVNLKAWPNDWVPFIWNRPEKVPGYYDEADLVDLPEPDSGAIRPDLVKSKELPNLGLDEPLRKIFSLRHARRSQHNKAHVEEQMQKLGLIHKVDYSMSLEAKIISLTYSLRHLYESIKFNGEDDNYNGHQRQIANSFKYRRYRYLCDLKELHGDRYSRLIKLLDLEPKDNPINTKFYRPFRKVQMRKLAFEYAQDLKEKKVEEFVESLQKEKVDFEIYKQETLKWIEEKECLLKSLDEVQQPNAGN